MKNGVHFGLAFALDILGSGVLLVLCVPLLDTK